MRQPDNICYTLFDSEIREYLIENGLTSGQGITYREQRMKPTAWVNVT